MCINRRLSYLFGSNQYQRIISCRIGNVQQVRPCQAHTSDADTWQCQYDRTSILPVTWENEALPTVTARTAEGYPQNAAY